MDTYLVSARKYRPSTFQSVVGQKALTSTLKNAIASGRLAHSYLFCGSRGVGKTSCARIMAKTINCENRTPDGEACNECPSCRAFNAGNSLNIIELDAASNNSVDDIRNLTDQVLVPPSSGRYRVFIIDEVHMLSSAAFNAFLKTLEEPPAYVVFILATTEKHKILPTILSRCQIYDFNRITIQDMIDHLGYVASQEGITADPAALNIIARKADGAMRDALSIFDQVAAASRGNITYESTIDNLNVLDGVYYNRLLDAFLEGDVMKTWLIYKEIREKGFDSLFFINGLASYMRDLMVARDPSTMALLEAGDDARRDMAERAAKCTPVFLYRAMDLCNDADLNYRTASNKQFLIELTLAKICQLQSPSPDQPDGNGKGLKKIAVIPASTPQPTTAIPAAAPTGSPATPTQTPPVQPPATASATRPAPTASPRPALRPTGMPRLSIHHRQAEASRDTAAESHGQAPQRNRPFTDAEIRNAWESYIAAHPAEHILANTMRASLPVRSTPDGTGFTVTVENDLQQQLLTDRSAHLLAFLRDRLENDTIDIAIDINRGESAPITWNQRQVFDHMLQNVPHFKDMVADLGLKL